jgi:trehalose 6-phosphate phosphatase
MTLREIKATGDGSAAGWRESNEAPPALPRGCALFLDFDGTLVHLEDHPSLVRADEALHALLGTLGVAMAGAVALVSGRTIAELDALLVPARLAIAGQHGAERRSVDGTMHYHAPLSPRFEEAALALRRLVAAHPQLLLEEKGASLALHYRARPSLGPLVEQEARRVLRSLGEGFALQAGKFVVELKPSGKDKGTAITEFMAEAPFAGRLPVFVGDDLTDELGFEVVNRLGGHTVKVGSGITKARWRLRDADAVRGWLADGTRESGPAPA